MDTSELKEALLPCAPDFPYIFISYCSKDKEQVWKDVIELQQRGYNVWIDEANLNKAKDSWKDDALKAIENNSCEVVLFYISQDSLISKPCLNELNKTRSDDTRETHFVPVDSVPVDFIAIETEPVVTIEEYSLKIRATIESCPDLDERNEKMRTLTRVISSFLPLDNNKVRILSRDDPARVGDYYDDIIRQLEACRRSRDLHISKERCYRIALDRYIRGQFTTARKFLELADGYAAADLLLAHMYYLGNADIKPNRDKAASLWAQVDEYCKDSWLELGKALDEEKYYSEALAYILAYGEKNEDGDSMYQASKLWVKKGCRSEVISALALAVRFGTNKDANNALIQFDQKTTDTDCEKAAQKYLNEETPVH